jgi:hypothetical protein
MMLPSAMRKVILPYITEYTDQDFLHDLIVCCYEAMNERKAFSKFRAKQIIDTMIRERNRENNILYNPFRNISINQCFGESKVPVSEWMNLSEWREWD